MNTKTKVIAYLFFTLCYIGVSNRMGHYYTNAEGRKVVSTADKILLTPLNIYADLMTGSAPTKHSENNDFLGKSKFYLNFISWPCLVLIALAFWTIFIVSMMIMAIFIIVSLIFTVFLWGLTYIMLGVKLF